MLETAGRPHRSVKSKESIFGARRPYSSVRRLAKIEGPADAATGKATVLEAAGQGRAMDHSPYCTELAPPELVSTAQYQVSGRSTRSENAGSDQIPK
jgi:hypothetical protein